MPTDSQLEGSSWRLAARLYPDMFDKKYEALKKAAAEERAAAAKREEAKVSYNLGAPRTRVGEADG